MKIFDRIEPFTSKVNFVDENGTLVGYDLDKQCCENAGWFISYSICTTIEEDISEDLQLEDYWFDDLFFQKVSFNLHPYDSDNPVLEGVIFSLYTEDKPNIFLHLFNHHNGYYTHGFHLLSKEVATQTGEI